MPKYYGGGSGGSGGAVSSVFGRIGAVVATLGDYSGSLITNDSTNPGADVSAALEACVLTNGTRALAGSWSLANNALTAAKTFTFDSELDNGNSGAAKLIVWPDAQAQKVTLTDNCAITFTAPPGVGAFQLKLVQDGIGSRTATWPVAVQWPGGTAPVLSTTAGAVDIISFYYDGALYWGTLGASGAADNVTITLTGAGLLQRAALTGDITATAGSNATAIAAGVIVNADVNAAAAIAGTKIAPDFGSQDVTTTGNYKHGASPATTGAIRLSNGDQIYARSTVGSDAKLVHFTNGDTAVYGDSAFPSIYNGLTTTLRVNNIDVVALTSGVVGVAVTNLRFGSAVVDPVIFQQTDTANSITGDILDIHAQDCTGTTTTGGRLSLRPGTGTTANGQGRLNDAAGAFRIRWDSIGVGFFAAAPVAQQTPTGSRGGNAALADLLTKLALTGLIVDGTSA